MEREIIYSNIEIDSLSKVGSTFHGADFCMDDYTTIHQGDSQTKKT